MERVLEPYRPKDYFGIKYERRIIGWYRVVIIANSCQINLRQQEVDWCQTLSSATSSGASNC